MRRLVGALSIAAVLAALWFLGQSWRGLPPLDFGWFAVGLALMLAQTWLVAVIWRELSGRAVTVAEAYRVVHLAALGKYLPGKVWAFGGVAVLAREAGIPGTVAAFASGSALALVAASGIAIGLVAYGAWQAELVWLGAVASVALALGPWAAAALCRAERSEASNLVRSPAAMAGAASPRRTLLSLPALTGAASALRATGAAFASWLLLAAAGWATARAIWPAVPADAAPLLASSVAGWAAGLAVVAVPAGLGVREAVQALALADVVPPATAAAYALVVRAALVFTDVVAAAIAWRLRAGRINHADRPPIGGTSAHLPGH